jgi:hypothetical protein
MQGRWRGDAGEAHQQRLVQLGPRELGKHRGHGRGEEQCLSRRRDRAEDSVELRGEAHLEEPVGLVAYHVLDARERELGVDQHVLQPAGRAHQDVRVTREHVEL